MKENNKILIIKNDHIGDLVLAEGVFREIKKYLPDSKVTFIASKLNKPIIEKNKNIDEIIELEIPQYKLKTIWNFFKTSLKLRKEKFDYGIDMRGSMMNSFFLLFLAGVKNRISRTDIHSKISLFLNKPIKLTPGKHLIEDNLDIINKGLEISAKNPHPEIITDEDDEKEVNNFIKKNNLKDFICICPVAGLDFKQWPLENFKELINQISKKYPSKNILILGTDKDKASIEKISNSKCKVYYNFNIRQMSLLFKKSSLVIAQDGGPLAIAWVSGAKVIALIPKNFRNPTTAKDFEKVKPLGNSVIINSKVSESMEGIELEDVLKAVKSMLNK